MFLEILQNSREKTCVRTSYINTVAGWPATLLKKRPRHKCFPVNFAKFLRTSFFIELLWRLRVYFSSTSQGISLGLFRVAVL